MAKPGRPRKSLAPRHPSGRLVYSRKDHPSLMQRALQALRRKADNPIYGGISGLLELTDEISHAERIAGERFARDCLAYRRLASAPASRPSTSSLEQLGHGRNNDVDLDLLDPPAREAVTAQERAVAERHQAACSVILKLPEGKRIMRKIENVFISETEPEVHEIPMLRLGLTALSKHYA